MIVTAAFPSIDTPRRGIFVLNQAVALRDAGIRVGIIYPYTRSMRDMRWSNLRQNAFKYHFDDSDGIPKYYCTAWASRSTRLRVAEVATRRLINTYVRNHGQPDIIHAHFARVAGQCAQRAASRLGIPFAIHEHSSELVGLSAPSAARELAATFHKADLVFAVSNYLASNLPNSADKLFVVPNVVDTAFFRPDNTDFAFEPLSLLTVGSFIPRKQLHKSIDLLPDLPASTKLRIIGDGPLESELKRKCNELKLADRVEFIPAGTREVVRDAMRSSNVLLSTSTSETFGMTVAEGMSMGLAVASTQSGGTADVLAGTPGTIYTNDVADTLAWLTALKKTPRRDISEDAKTRRKIMVDRYSGEAVGSLILRHYRRIL